MTAMYLVWSHFNFLERCFLFVCDKINALVNHENEIDLKTVMQIWKTQLYGLYRLFKDIKDIRDNKVDGIYISKITTKDNILDKREYYDESETLLTFYWSVFDFKEKRVEIEVTLQWDQYFLFKVKDYDLNFLYQEDATKSQNVLKSKLTQIIEPPNLPQINKNDYVASLNLHLLTIKSL